MLRLMIPGRSAQEHLASGARRSHYAAVEIPAAPVTESNDIWPSLFFSEEEGREFSYSKMLSRECVQWFEERGVDRLSYDAEILVNHGVTGALVVRVIFFGDAMEHSLEFKLRFG